MKATPPKRPLLPILPEHGESRESRESRGKDGQEIQAAVLNEVGPLKQGNELAILGREFWVEEIASNLK